MRYATPEEAWALWGVTVDGLQIKPAEQRTGVTRLLPGERQELLQFRSRVHGAESILANPAYFRWMYDEAPSKDPQRLPCWVHRSRESIDGQLGGFPATLQIGRVEESALWMLDGAVEPEKRGRGIFGLLLESAARQAPVAMVTECSPGARRVMLARGWSDLGTLPLFVRLLDARALLSARGHPTAGRTIGSLVDAAARALDGIALLACKRAGLRLEIVGRFDRRSDQIWQEVSPYYPVICRRDLTYLDWRFSSFPGPRYCLAYLLQGGEPVGYVVLRFGLRGGLPAAFLADYLCPPDLLSGLLTLCIGLCHERAQSTLCCVHLNPVSVRPFLLHGFRHRDTGWPFLAYSGQFGSAPGSDQRASVFDRRAWFLTAADSDLDRPRPEEDLPAPHPE
jgi:GNAT superfamily N-acetyltransferase